MRARRAATTVLVSALAWLASVHAAVAQPAADPDVLDPNAADVEEARLAFGAGRAAYAAGRFEQALAEFRHAYALTHDAEVLYNVALVAERLRHDRDALQAYQGYLEARPSAPERANIEGRIAVLRRAVARQDQDEGSQRAGAGEHGAGAEARTDRAGAGLRIGAWIATGVTVLSAGLSLSLWLVGDSAYDDLSASCPCTQAQIDQSSVPTWDVLTNIFLVTSVAAGVTAATLFVLDLTLGGDHDVHVALGPGQLSVRGRL